MKMTWKPQAEWDITYIDQVKFVAMSGCNSQKCSDRLHTFYILLNFIDMNNLEIKKIKFGSGMRVALSGENEIKWIQLTRKKVRK